MATEAQKESVKRMLIHQLRLRMDPSEIDDTMPLFGEGLGLDSVDAIELVTAIEQEYGVIIANEEVARRAFGNVSTLTDYIVEQGGLP